MIRDSELSTARLRIRPFGPADAPILVAILADPAVARYVGDGRPLSAEDARLWVTRSSENLRSFGYGTGAVVDRASDAVIGWAGFARPEDGPKQIVYGLVAACWGRGLGREIVEALVTFADRQDMATIAATVDPANARSIRLLEDSGFRLRDHAYGGADDCALYLRDRARDPLDAN